MVEVRTFVAGGPPFARKVCSFVRGFAAAHGGKPLAYRPTLFLQRLCLGRD